MIKVCGIGPGHPNYLTFESYKIIKESEKVYAFKRAKETLKDIRDDIVEISSLKNLLPLGNENITILASGDPLFFGICKYLKDKGVEIEAISPGISSYQYLMAKLNLPWQDAFLGSLHNRKIDFKNLLKEELIILLTDLENNPNYISKELSKIGFQGRIIAGYDLSYPEEKIIEKTIGESFDEKNGLAVVVVINEMV